MCSSSNVNEVLRATQSSGAGAGGGASGGAIQQISAGKLLRNRDDYIVVDVRELEEVKSDPLVEITTNINIPLDILLRDASSGTYEEWKSSAKPIVTVCDVGYRASVAAAELARLGFRAMTLQRGLLGLQSPAATVPDLVVTLGVSDSSERITFALSACAAAAAAGDQGQTVVLVLLSDAVTVFLREDSEKAKMAFPKSLPINQINQGEPFQPCRKLLAKFLDSGNGTILGCTSCVKHRNLEFADLMDCVKPMNMPDLLRMLGEAKSSLQFN